MEIEKCQKSKMEDHFAGKWKFTLMVALTTAILLVSCQNPERQASVPDQSNVSTEEVATNPNRYVGKIVTVRSEPVKKISPSTFTLWDQQFFGSNPVLVVNASGKPFTFPTDAGTDIQVTGQVRNFVFADIERQYNLGLDATAYQEYENQPVIVAQSIAISPEPGQLTSNPQQYYGKPLAVTGEVEDIKGVSAFTLDKNQLIGGQDLLVVYAPRVARSSSSTANQSPTSASPLTNQSVTVQDGEKVAVTGVLRPFVVAELERDYGFNWDAGIVQKLEAEYRNKPVLVAEGIYPSAIPSRAQ